MISGITKTCTKCSIEKTLDNYHNDKRASDGVVSHCKVCSKNYHKKRYIDNIDKIKNSHARYRENNKEKEKSRHKKYSIENPEKIKLNEKKWREANLERSKNNKKEWWKNNPNYSKEYKKRRRETEPLYKLKNDIRYIILNSFKDKGFKKNTKTLQILGCTFEEFKVHLESKFESWMTWNNRGNWNGQPSEINTAWDVDHIIPLASAINEEDVIRLNHYTNLQPLCSYTNRYIKRANY